jgi:hypothetical protein
MSNNKLVWVIGILSVVMIVVGIGNKVFIDKVADRVIQKLQKEYSPSPYGPGIDPDKLDVEKLKKKSNSPVVPYKASQPVSGWNEDWERMRK